MHRSRSSLVLAVALILPTPGLLFGQDAPFRLVPIAPPLGCAACDGPEAFGVVLGIAIGVDGALAVADRDPPHIRLFEPDGSIRTTFGRSGRGPGEFGTPSGVALIEGGEIAAADFRWTDVRVYSGGGDVVTTHEVESTTLALRADPTGRWITWQVADWTTMSGGVTLLGPDGTTSVPLPTTVERVVNEEGEAAGVGLFAAAPGPDGRVAVGAPGVYRFLVLRPDGTTLHEIRRDIPRTERTDEEIAELEERLRRGPAAAAGNPEGAARPEVDPLRPHFTTAGVAYDAEARLWVQTPRDGPGRTVFDVFAAEGAYLGEVRLDVELETFTIGGDVLAGVVEDPATGVQTVRRWRVESSFSNAWPASSPRPAGTATATTASRLRTRASERKLSRSAGARPMMSSTNGHPPPGTSPPHASARAPPKRKREGPATTGRRANPRRELQPVAGGISRRADPRAAAV